MRALTQAARSQRVSAWARTTLPPSAVRRRTGLIFFLGVSFLILATVAVTGWINSLVNQDSQRIILLQELIQQATTWQLSSASPAGADLEYFAGAARRHCLRSGLNDGFYGRQTSPADILIRREARNGFASRLIGDVSKWAARKSS